MIIYTPKIVFAMSILNQPRKSGYIEPIRTKEEMSHCFFEDRNDDTWLFWHLQVARYAAIDAGEASSSLWRLLIDRALAALRDMRCMSLTQRQRDHARSVLKQTIYEIDEKFNGGEDARAEAARRAAGLEV